MRRRKNSADFSGSEESLINLTPLIDVVFVVLVAFILIAPLLEIDLIDLAAGSENTQKDFSGRSAICIYVKQDDSIWLHHRPVSLIELQAFLKEAHRRTPKEIPQIFHDRKACFGTYQSIKNSVEEAGFEQMHIFLKSSS